MKHTGNPDLVEELRRGLSPKPPQLAGRRGSNISGQRHAKYGQLSLLLRLGARVSSSSPLP